MRNHKLNTTEESKPYLLQQALKRQTEVPDARGIISSQRDLMEQVTCRLGDTSCASAHASTLNRATVGQPAHGVHSLLQLQRQYGNRYVQRVLALSRQGEGNAEVAPDVEQAIQRVRGGGQALDRGVRTRMEPAFRADFSGVRVHADAEADMLNRGLNAQAFTVGQHIFFGQGTYNSGTSSGRELLAHELTHVVQQNGDQVQRKLTVGQLGDRYEQEADQTAQDVMQREKQVVTKETEQGLMPRQAKEEGILIVARADSASPQVQRRVQILSDPLPPGVLGPPSRWGADFIERALEQFTDLNLSFDGDFLAVDARTRRAVLRERRQRPTPEAVRARLFIIPGVSREKASAALKLAQIILDTRATAIIQPVFGEAPVLMGAFPVTGGGGIQRIDIEDIQEWQMLTEPSIEPVRRVIAFLRRLLGLAAAARPATPLRTFTAGSVIHHEIVESFRAALAGPGTVYAGPHRRAVDTANVALRAMGNLEFLPCPSPPPTAAPGGEFRIRTFWRQRRGAGREDRFTQDWFLSAPPTQALTWVDPPVLQAANVATGSPCPP